VNIAKIAATTGTVVVAAAGGAAVFALAEPPSGSEMQGASTRTVASALDQPAVPAPQPAASLAPSPTAVHEYAKASVAAVSGGGRTAAGFVVSPDGLIVSSTRVLDGARGVTVTLGGPGGPEHEAVVLAGDRAHGLAVLRFDAGAAGAAPLSFSERTAAAGDHVYAIAASQPPRGATVTAVDRDLQAQDGSTVAGAIKTDASIEPGAPVLDARGAVVGVASQTGGRRHVVPASAVQALLAQATAGAAAAG
jgi:putative serine protease PepD